MFKQIFSKKYWVDSFMHFRSVRSIALMGILMGACVCVGGLCQYFPLKIFDRQISLLFVFWPILACLFGPIPTTIIAGIVDLLIFLLFPTGYPMYIGYTFTQMLVGFINGIMFYKSKISILKLFIAKFIINFGIHVGIESLFMADIMEYSFSAYKAYVIGGASKNALLLPFETAFMVVVCGALLPLLRVINKDEEKFLNKISIF